MHPALLSAGMVIAVSSPWTRKRNVEKLRLDNVSMTFKTPTGAFQALAPVTLVDFARPLRQPDRTFGLRQEHDLQHRCRAAGTDRRPRADRRRRCHRHHRPRRLHAAEGSAAAVAHRARQRHPRHGNPGRAAARRRASGRCRCCSVTDFPASNISIRTRCPAACGSARRCCARCCSTPTSFCSTSRSARSTRRPSCRCRNGCCSCGSDFGKTVVFVTHDVEEAIYLSDEVHVMATRPGRIVETIPVPIARPRERSATLTPEFIAIKERCLAHLMTDTCARSTRRRDMTVQDTRASGTGLRRRATGAEPRGRRDRCAACRCRRTGRPGRSSPSRSAFWWA